jgi:hypothetical protein
LTVDPPGTVDDQDGDADSGDEGLASVVSVDRREDIAGICGRVDGAPTFAVVVHAPAGNRQLSTELGMRRLQRHVEDSGKVIAIATTNATLAARARQVGIPVARQPEHVRWDSAGRRVMRLGHRTLRLPVLGRYVQVALLFGVALLFLGAAATLAPSATITVYPATETLSRTVVLTAAPDATSIDFQALRVPSTKVTAKQRITLASKSTGTVSVGTVPAKAALRISNPGGATVDVAVNAIVNGGPDAVPFELDTAITVAPGAVVTVSATALRPGGAGNLGPNLIGTWADPRYRTLAVANPASSAGGVNEDRPGISANDLVAIRQLANDLGKSDSVKPLLATVRPHDAVFLTTAETTIDFPDPPLAAGTQADVILMNVDLTITAYAVLEATLDQVASHVLTFEQGAGQLIQGTVTATETGARQVDSATGTIRTEVEVRGEFVRNLSVADLKDAVKGKSVDDAKSTVKGMYGIQDADVSVSPSWAPWLPRFSFRIGVELKNKAAEDAAKGSPSNDAAAATATKPPTAAATARP